MTSVNTRFARNIIYVCLAVVPFVFNPIGYNTFRLPKQVFVDVVLLLLALLLLSDLAGGVNWLRRLYPGRRWLIGFGFCAILSCLLSSHPLMSLIALVHVGLYIMLVFIAAAIFNTRQRLKLVWIYLATAALMSLYALFQYHGIDPLFTARRAQYTERWLAAGFVGQPTLMGGYLSMAPFLALGVMFYHRDKLTRVISALALSLSVLGIFLSHTRAVILALVTGIPIFILVGLRFISIKFRITITAGALILILLLILIFAPTLAEKFAIFFSQYQMDTSGPRFFYWAVAISMIADNPLLGIGPGGFRLEYYDYAPKVLQWDIGFIKHYSGVLVREAHNEYLQLAAEVGLPGILCLLIWLYVLLKKAIAGHNNLKSNADKALQLGIILAVGAVFFDAIFSFPFQLAVSSFPATLFIGIAAGIDINNNDTTKPAADLPDFGSTKSGQGPKKEASRKVAKTQRSQRNIA